MGTGGSADELVLAEGIIDIDNNLDDLGLGNMVQG
jgi:hypothetical protein